MIQELKNMEYNIYCLFKFVRILEIPTKKKKKIKMEKLLEISEIPPFKNKPS